MGKVIDYINTLDIDEEYYRIFGKHIPQGKCFCPFHHNVNTPAAKKYGNVIHCFSCNRSYGTYDLLKKYDPSRIEELKQTVVMDAPPRYQDCKFNIVPINRNGTIEEALNTILNN